MMSKVDDLELQLKREKMKHSMAYRHAARADAERAEADMREARARAEVETWKSKCARMEFHRAELVVALGLDILCEWDVIIAMVKAMADNPE